MFFNTHSSLLHDHGIMVTVKIVFGHRNDVTQQKVDRSIRTKNSFQGSRMTPSWKQQWTIFEQA